MMDSSGLRQEILKGIIHDLHAGEDMERLKQRFANLLDNVSASEVSEMESRLIAEGMPPEEIKRLCDVHMAVFKEGLEHSANPDNLPGHPVHTYHLENEAISRVVETIRELLGKISSDGNVDKHFQEMQSQLKLLREINKHYLRKENQLFPALEQKGISGPPKVMWQVHDDIRGLLKDLTRAVEGRDVRSVVETGNKMVTSMTDMIFKEENILFPMALEKLTQSDWARVRLGEEEIGYALVTPGDQWQPPAQVKEKNNGQQGQRLPEMPPGVKLHTGEMTLEQIDLVFRHLPVDVTFVDNNDQVRYYSQGKHRIFPRSPGIIGRNVQDCHPSGSVHMVNKIVESFKSGEKDYAEFWLELKGSFIQISYFAVRSDEGEYRGIVEVSQDVTDIRALEGEKRLLDW
ncbi:MAG: DUF438 domain-containing protein [Bacillota bacterium]